MLLSRRTLRKVSLPVAYLRISIGTVGQVLQRQTEVGGVRVSYDIGRELYKE
jgi:hypothetical protein